MPTDVAAAWGAVQLLFALRGVTLCCHSLALLLLVAAGWLPLARCRCRCCGLLAGCRRRLRRLGRRNWAPANNAKRKTAIEKIEEYNVVSRGYYGLITGLLRPPLLAELLLAFGLSRKLFPVPREQRRVAALTAADKHPESHHNRQNKTDTTANDP